MTETTHDIVIVGGGTAGLVTAAGAAALGARAALVERAQLGGECLWTGCVPSKALIAFARKRRETASGSWEDAVRWLHTARDRIAPHDSPERFRSLGVDVIHSPARLLGGGRVETATRQLRAKRIVIATGSAPAVPPIPGLASAGFLTHVTAYDQPRLPASIAILGGGPVGLEFAQTYRRLGVQVTVLELLPEVLPKEAAEVGRFIRERLTDEGVTVLTGFRAIDVRSEGATKAVVAEDGRRVTAAELFVSAGRTPNTADLDLARAGVELDNGAVRVNARLETTARGIWAAGDVTGGLQFTHVADYMARVVVQNALAPLKTRARYHAVPRVTFTDPEVAHVGVTTGPDVTRVDFAEIDRAVVDGRTAGFCRILTRGNGAIVGATIVGAGAGELIMPLVLAMRHGITLGRLGSAVYPYPTMSEIVKRASGEWSRRRYGDTFRGRMLRRIVRWWR